MIKLIKIGLLNDIIQMGVKCQQIHNLFFTVVPTRVQDIENLKARITKDFLQATKINSYFNVFMIIVSKDYSGTLSALRAEIDHRMGNLQRDG